MLLICLLQTTVFGGFGEVEVSEIGFMNAEVDKSPGWQVIDHNAKNGHKMVYDRFVHTIRQG